LGGLAALVIGAGALVTARGETAGASAPPETTPAPVLLPDFEPYIFRENGPQADPINLVFRGADTAATARAIQDVTGWQPVTAAKMNFHDQGVTHTTGSQFQLPLSPVARYHLRVEATSSASQGYTLAAAHRDDTATCGHVGNAFDQSRDLIANAFARAGYRVTLIDRGNVAPGPQCDGSLTNGDGKIAVIDLGGQ
jgi:hypothetical protein